MQTQKVTDMTIEELKDLIQHIVDERLQQQAQSNDSQSVQEILRAIEQHRWTPPPGTPKASQMIIEEREQWRQGM
ncbi:hypothetical protein K9N68_25620 [Kovacikia minuta CCNUW1]|uniref:hypothetical protein n=1 Tax=Kovacikia minuta TaxID=2931930 RepID=UPI001CCEBAA5|nr:hypothetical protein [Kovacikia minuta]UBF24990.1 hypothetical protein K9N68_25620 [Kovacikia minuta CCNUW1]